MIYELEKLCSQKNFNKAKAEQLISQIDVNQVFKDSRFALETTLLMFATEEANYDMVELLLKNGASPNLVYGKKLCEESAFWDLQYSSHNEEEDQIRLSIVKLLLENGANPHLKVDGEDLYDWSIACWQDDMGIQADYRSKFIDLLEEYDVMKRFVFLDLDDTIFDFHKAERIALSKTLGEMGLAPDPAVLSRYSEINAAQWRLLEEGKLTRAEVKVRRYQLLFEEFGMDVSPTLAARTYERNLSIGHFYVEGAEELLRRLSREYRLFLVSNGSSDIQRSRIGSSDIHLYFEKMFISEEIGFNKPDARFFDAVFAQIPGFDRARAVIVGDSLSSDIRGGKNAGIRTVWFNPHGKEAPADLLPDASISSLCELPALLTRL